MGYLKKLICRLFGHKFVNTQLSYNIKTLGEADWSRVVKDGPKYCKRCGFLDADLDFPYWGDPTKIEVTPKEGQK